MKRIDLVRHLERYGCQLLREGGSHSVCVNRATRKSSAVLPPPRDQFWAVGWQIEQEEFEVGLPALGDGGFDILMDRGIVQSQEGEFVGVRGFRQMVKEWNDVFSPDVVFVKLEMKFSLGVV